MSHVRKQIRDAVAALLPGTVHKSRVYPLDEAELPVKLVYTNGEQIAADQFGGLERRLEVVVEIVAAGTDDAMDAVLVDVEQALGDGLGSIVTQFVASSIEVSTSTEGSAPIGRLRLVYEAIYRTAFADPETNL